MKTTIYSTVLFFISSILSAQSELDTPVANVASPQAMEITKFGDIPVNEFSGRVSPTVPVYNYTAGSLSVPINLNYSGNGVKVEQKPTWTGMNWLLDAGGVITRVVRDMPDENSQNRIFYSEAQLEGMREWYNHIFKLPEPLSNDLAQSPDAADSEADLFSFSFSGYSGSFFLKEDANGILKAHQLKYDTELKIEIEGEFTKFGNYAFLITTPDGTRYTFGGLVNIYGAGAEPPSYAIEETQFVGLRGSQVPQMGIRSKTAFYLTKIENHLGDAIFFEYFTHPEQNVLSASNFTRSLYVDDMDVGNNCPMPLGNDEMGPQYLRNKVFNAKYLKQVTNNRTSQKIKFNSFEVQNPLQQLPFNLNFRILSEIDYGIGKVIFDYLPSKASFIQHRTPREKFFLETVSFTSSSNSIEQQYRMEYKSPLALPQNGFSTGQDILGYFNGKTNNPTLLPRNSKPFFDLYFNGIATSAASESDINFTQFASLLGDRSSYFAFATLGMLDKIHYPTGGHTAFEYEPVEKKYEYAYDSRTMRIYQDMGNATGYTFLPLIPSSMPVAYSGIGDTPILQVGEPVPTSEPVFQNQEIQFHLDTTIYNRPGANDRDYIYIQIKETGSNSAPAELRWHFPRVTVDDFRTNFIDSLSYTLRKGARYTFKMGFGALPGGSISSSHPPVECSVAVRFITGINELNDGTGIRIKRVKDFGNSSDTAPATSKRFYYKSIKQIRLNEDEKKKILFTPLFHTLRMVNTTCQASTGMIMKNFLLLTLNTNSFSMGLPSSDVYAVYPVVTTSYGGDNFEQGGTEQEFLVYENKYSKNFMSPKVQPTIYEETKAWMVFNDSKTSNKDAFNGLPVKKTFWRKRGNILEKIKEAKYAYTITKTDSINNINGQRIANVELSNLYAEHYFGLYETSSYKLQKSTETQTEFMDGVPIASYITPPVYPGPPWALMDDDGDGIPNGEDDEYITPEEFFTFEDSYIEQPFRKMVTTERTSYHEALAGLASEVKKYDDAGTISHSRYFYAIPQDISQLSGLSGNDISAYSGLQAANRIGSPIQSDAYGKNGNLISSIRKIYFTDAIGTLLPGSANSAVKLRKIQTRKNLAHDFEDEIYYNVYDDKGNPAEIQSRKGSPTAYVWSANRQPLFKVENASYASVMSALSAGGGVLDPNAPPMDGNPLAVLLPNSLVTVYNYDPFTNLLKTILDPKGNLQTFEYNEFNRLEKIRDKDGNIISSYQNHLKTQN